jgi:membrane protease YdiL (CAAX protease family)
MHADKTLNRTTTIAILGLLLVRLSLVIPLLPFDSSLYKQVAFVDVTYICTLFIIYANRRRLEAFFIDKLSFMVIAGAGPVHLILSLVSYEQFPTISGVLMTAASIAFVIATILSKTRLPGGMRRQFLVFGIGILAGIVISVVLNIGGLFNGALAVKIGKPSTEIITRMAYMLVFLFTSSVYEEPLFRGFLLAKLQGLKIGAWLPILIQAALFTLGHLYFFPRSEFWLLAPVCGLGFGYIVTVTRSLCSSMSAHAAVNALVYVIGSFMASAQ